MARAGHGVAAIAMWVPGHSLTDPSIRLQCECGWYCHIDGPTTVDYLAITADGHAFPEAPPQEITDNQEAKP